MVTVEFIQSGTHGTGQVLDYHTLPIVTYVLTGNVLLLFLYLACTTKQRISLFLVLLQGHQSPFVCFVASSQFTTRDADISEGSLKLCIFLISNSRRVVNVVRFLLGNSPASEFYMRTFRNTVCSIFIGR
jgi:hypothetical protein